MMHAVFLRAGAVALALMLTGPLAWAAAEANPAQAAFDAAKQAAV